MKNEFYCKFCNSVMFTSYNQYKENKYCNNCLEERLKLGNKLDTSIKTFGSFRPLKTREQKLATI